MHARTVISQAIGLALLIPGMTHAEVSVRTELKNETAVFVSGGKITGAAKTTLDKGEEYDAGDLAKFENSARFFLNGDISDDITWHADLQLIYDPEPVDDQWRGHKNYSQYDYFRELYMDIFNIGTEEKTFDLRLGKQQVVWGRADGIKLLDVINPTDFRELMQAPMEDSRVPVWMLNAETQVGETGDVQVLWTQARPSVIPGLTDISSGSRAVPFGVVPPGPTNPFGVSNGDIDGTSRGHPFIMKGVDTISGQVNGLLNIGAAMGAVTTTFSGGGFTTGAAAEAGTVGAFAADVNGSPTFPVACGPAPNGAACLKNFTELTNQNITNLIDASPMTGAGWNVASPTSMWEYHPNATFATFNAFSGDMGVGMSTRYERDHPDDFDTNAGLRYRGSLDNGLNFSFNYLYAYDPNPVVQIHWEDPTTGETLTTIETPNSWVPGGGSSTIVQLVNSAGQAYGATWVPTGPAVGAGVVNNFNGMPAQLVFEETLERVHNFGASFDYALDLEDMPPIVLRGEFLYKKDVRSPIIDRNALARGNFTQALKAEEGDWFNYVLGAEITVLRNLLISGQFIQYRNLDYVDKDRSCNLTALGLPGVVYDCSRYTADPATMHLSNGFDQAEENKEFYSLFLSKPFGPSDEHRWNNIIIYEEGGGYWNRFDAEYTFSDELIGTFEWNQYWGDSDETIFGQFDNSSSLQVGIRYIFE